MIEYPSKEISNNLTGLGKVNHPSNMETICFPPNYLVEPPLFNLKNDAL